MDVVKHCLTCMHEPEWEEDVDIFNHCEHCNKHEVGFCKRIYDFMKVIPSHKWPLAFSFERLEARRYEEKPEHRVRVYRKDHPRIINECPAWELKV